MSMDCVQLCNLPRVLLFARPTAFCLLSLSLSLRPNPPILIGSGHNGLTAFYLAKAELRPLVLERRDVVGGAAVTEAIAPGIAARWPT